MTVQHEVHLQHQKSICLALLAAVLTGGCSLMSGGGDVPRFETPGWQQAGWILMRQEAFDSQAILLKHSERDVIYRYSARDGMFSGGESSRWDAAETPVIDCLLQSMLTRHPARIGPPNHDLIVSGRQVKTAGRTALSLHVNPSVERAAVVSAAGLRRPNLLPFLGGSRGAWGQHYHEIFSHPDYRLLQKAVRIPVGNKDEVVKGCWSPADRFLVYTDEQFRFICFVPVAVASNPKAP